MFEVLDVKISEGWSLSCRLDSLYEGLGISLVNFDKKNIKFFYSFDFFQFLVIKSLDLDPESMNPDQQHR